LGKADDYTRTTAETSRRLADEQIFAPERDEFDSFINRRLLPDMGIIYHKFKSNSPNTTDNTQLVKILAGAEKTGGMTPRIARTLLEDILSMELPPLPEDFPSDVPFSLSMAEAVKNKADPAEPGQQVTALKLIDALTGSQPDGDEILVEHAQKLNEFMERRFRSVQKNLNALDLDALSDEG
jgi:capsid portal protein